jgi:transposase
MLILWEYRKIWPEGYGYSRFCELLREFQQRLSPVMRQHHVAGDKLFVDYSGKRLPINDPLRRQPCQATRFGSKPTRSS